MGSRLFRWETALLLAALTAVHAPEVRAQAPGDDTPTVTIREVTPADHAPAVKKRAPRRPARVRSRTAGYRATLAPRTAAQKAPRGLRRAAVRPAPRRTRQLAAQPPRPVARRAPAPFAPPTAREVRRAPETAASLNERAYRLQLRGRHREAEPLLRRALQLDPDYAHAQYNLGWCLVAQGKAREAVDWLLRTARRQPDRWEPYLRLAEAYEQLGQKARAAAAYARARLLGYGEHRAARR
jgi:predicted Zn-dependent protease